MFYAYLSGGGGCDYTMGCNRKLVKLKGETWEEARKSAAEEYEKRADQCEDVLILEVQKTEDLDIAQIEEEMAADRHKAAAEEEEKEARTQYDRLKRRFGD